MESFTFFPLISMPLENTPRYQDQKTEQKKPNEQTTRPREVNQRLESKLEEMEKARQDRITIDSEIRQAKQQVMSRYPTLEAITRNVDDDLLYMNIVDGDVILALVSYKSDQGRYFVFEPSLQTFRERLRDVEQKGYKTSDQPITIGQMRELVLKEQERKDLRK